MGKMMSFPNYFCGGFYRKLQPLYRILAAAQMKIIRHFGTNGCGGEHGAFEFSWNKIRVLGSILREGTVVVRELLWT